MWPFSIKKKGKRSIGENNQHEVVQLIDREHIHELDRNDTELRVWLPELCKQALDETIERCSTTGARYLRELFVVYLYGEHELLRMQEKKTGIYFVPIPVPQGIRKDSSPGIMYSKRPSIETVPVCGKNIVPLKLFLPETMKSDLQKMSDKIDIKLSTFVREILISHFLGHTLWQERLRSWLPEEEAVGKDWEEGVTESDYSIDDHPDDEVCSYS